MRRRRPGFMGLLLGVLLILLAGCTVLGGEQPKVEPLQPNAAFDFFQSARPLREGTVPHEPELGPELAWLRTGRQDGQLVETMPIPITEEMLWQGQEQYNIFCSPCHGLAGYGQGMVVQRGFPEPPSLHTARLRQAPDGHYFEVISHGFGDMFSYGERIEPAARWAVIAYIRALQLSQHMPGELLTDEDRVRLQAAPEE